MSQSQVQCVGDPPPQTWADYRKGCLSTYRGGHRGDEGQAFQHGMETVFTLLEHEFPAAELCQAAPELLAACEAVEAHETASYSDTVTKIKALAATSEEKLAWFQKQDRKWSDLRAQLRAAIAKAKRTE